MNNKTFKILITLLIISFIIMVWTIPTTNITRPTKIYPKTNLEIYTPSNIYYVSGLIVTNERDSDTLTFNNMRSLKNYISDRTASDLEVQY